MIDEKYIELMNKEIDGLNTPQESAELKSYLKDEPEAQKQFNNLLDVSKSLEQLEEIEPSPELKKSIINSINWKKYSTKEKKRRSFLGFTQLKFNVKYAYVFTCGLILGIIGFLSDITRQ